ncbi:hypothetical protein NCCP2140_08310 [Pseudoalteromonas sp. NCCP-2140]|nr:hypothetical protein [Pseudoalteromonas sp. NCCP-2140]GKW51778.1 hypothetical protein NCCP2140_08310 [Pseudoalteromonas sp. NCCP-2140]
MLSYYLPFFVEVGGLATGFTLGILAPDDMGGRALSSQLVA